PSFLSTKPPSAEMGSAKVRQSVRFSRLGSFLDLEPTSKSSEALKFDIPSLLHSSEIRKRFDVVVIGAGPSGLRLAEQVSARGIKVCVVDPSPLSIWPNNYGVWVDEFETLGLEDCLDRTWPTTCVRIDEGRTKHLDRAYGRVSRNDLKLKLLSLCAANGVAFHSATAHKLEHDESSSISSVTCFDGTHLKASLVVDASGFNSSFIDYDSPRKNVGFQIAHGILAEVDRHPFDLDKMLLMDWSDSHLGNEPSLRLNNAKSPTFLYAMPLDDNQVFLEETSLVSRPALPYAEVKKRMVARLRHLGIRVKSVIEKEKCVIPMGGPLPRIPQPTMAVGGNSGMVHPTTGYCLSESMAAIPAVAEAISRCLGSTRMIRGKRMYEGVWEALWTGDTRLRREFYTFGMEALLRLDLVGTRRLFDSFFDLDGAYWEGFLSRRLTPREMVAMGLLIFRRVGSFSGRADMVAKFAAPAVKMVRNMAVEA
ncbi:hypothetical protein M569_16348, partial [Genlisea aurea]